MEMCLCGPNVQHSHSGSFYGSGCPDAVLFVCNTTVNMRVEAHGTSCICIYPACIDAPDRPCVKTCARFTLDYIGLN